MPVYNYKIKMAALFVLIVFLFFGFFFFFKNLLTPEEMNVELLNQKSGGIFTEIYYVGEFDSGKGVVCIAKSQSKDQYLKEFLYGEGGGDEYGEYYEADNAPESLELVYFVKSRFKYSYRSRQTIPISLLTSAPSTPMKIRSSASYGNRDLYYVACLDNEDENADIDGKKIPLNTFDVELSGDTKTISIAYYISDKGEN